MPAVHCTVRSGVLSETRRDDEILAARATLGYAGLRVPQEPVPVISVVPEQDDDLHAPKFRTAFQIAMKTGRSARQPGRVGPELQTGLNRPEPPPPLAKVGQLVMGWVRGRGGGRTGPPARL